MDNSAFLGEKKMIDISGHLRTYKREVGFVNNDVPLEINCCGQQRFLTQDFSKSRPYGRLDYQLIYITHGFGTFTVQGKIQEVSAGNIVLYKPHEPQIYSYSCKDKTSAYWIHFTGNLVSDYLSSFDIRSGYIGDCMEIKALFQEMIRELQLKKTGYIDIVDADFKKLLALIHRNMAVDSTDRIDLKLEQVLIQLNQNYNKPWSITSMAGFCNLSESYFAHYFKEKIGVAPMKYLTNLRMEKAKFLLAESDIPVSSIAVSTGYSDVLYFSRIFKREVGESPTSFRNALNMNST